MKITVERQDDCAEAQIHIICPSEPNAESEKLLQMLNDFSVSLNAYKDGHTYRLRLRDILYIECVDDKTFLYSDASTYESR